MPAEPVSPARPAPRSRARLTRFIVVIALVTAVRLAALPLRGTEDVLTWKIWMIGASKNVTTVYGVGGHPPVRGELHWMHHSTTVDYPPVALYELGAAGLVYRLFDADFADRRALTAAVKIPGFLFGIALTVVPVVDRSADHRRPRPRRLGRARVLGQPRDDSQRRGARVSGPAHDAARDRLAGAPASAARPNGQARASRSRC